MKNAWRCGMIAYQVYVGKYVQEDVKVEVNRKSKIVRISDTVVKKRG